MHHLVDAASHAHYLIHSVTAIRSALVGNLNGKLHYVIILFPCLNDVIFIQIFCITIFCAINLILVSVYGLSALFRIARAKKVGMKKKEEEVEK